MQRRLHPRVRLQLPARLRWSAPLGQRTEQCQTINASRGGLLVACEEAHRPGNPLWITFPFDSNESNVQPESIARVVRCAKTDDDQAARWNLAIHFEGAAAYDSRRAGGRTGAARAQNGNGNSVAFPIRVRPPHIPWHEEAMTVELSRDRLKFRTNREYHF